MTTTGVSVFPLPAEFPDGDGGDDATRLVEHALRCAQEAAESLTIAAPLLAGAGTPAPLRATGPAGRGRPDRPWLTGQEHRVLTRLAAGLSNRQIAQSLGISDKTAKNYVHAVLSKLNAGSRTEAAFTALCERLVDLDECRRLRGPSGAGAVRPR
ncbi:helix-turn-helix domain-containing protein [Saccharothrix texasensis]|uniref:Regulatory LuxR family protein n=1 Tax=Saccharothrix texasensis TaxID=103734 RepID=A0A3N1GZX2_9PSEU|nr:helix-turn-helix transcriptional regulator [Saccharothrix texasensis]ROP35749.1 regulatory LuxR family protein [Saccharothrix texasensis]